MSYQIKFVLNLEKEFSLVKKCNLLTFLELLSEELSKNELSLNTEHSNLNVNINIVSNQTITSMNNKYIGHTGGTDVISFTYNEADLYGEIFVSPYTVQKNAKKFSQTFCNELYRVIIHGTLHVLGFLHSKKMFAKQEQVLDNLLNKMLVLTK